MAVLPTPGSPTMQGFVLGAARQDLHHALEFAGSPDHRVELVLASHLGEVATELVEDLAVLLVIATLGRPADIGAAALLAAGAAARTTLTGTAGRALVTRQQLDDLLAHPAQIGAQFDEHLSGDAFALTDQAEQDVLGADVVVSELECLAQGQLEHLLGARRERDVADGDEPPWPMISSTWLRTASSEMLNDSSALAATPSPS